MKFSEEYKKSAESMSPDREAMDRMKAAVLKELQEHPDVPAEPLPEQRKPLPLRRIAYIGGAVAACAAITFAAVNIVPSVKDALDIVSSTAAENTAGIDMSSSVAAEEIVADAADAAPSITEASPIYGGSEDICEDEAADLEDTTADTSTCETPDNGDAVNGSASSADITADSDSRPETTPTTTAAATESTPTESPDETIPASKPMTDGGADNGINGITDTEYGTEEPLPDKGHGNPEAGSSDDIGETLEAYSSGEAGYEETCESEEACATEEYDDRDNPPTGPGDDPGDESDSSHSKNFTHVVILTPNDWMTLDGSRYNKVPNVPSPGIRYQSSDAVYACSPDGKKVYWYLTTADRLFLYDVNYGYLGCYEHS